MPEMPIRLTAFGTEKAIVGKGVGEFAARSEHILTIAELTLSSPASSSREQQHHPSSNQHAIKKEGTYIFPFSLRLPICLPSSDTFPLDSKGRAVPRKQGYQIHYQLKATVGSKLQKCVPIRVESAPLPMEAIPCVVRPVFRPVQSVWSDAGQIAVGASLRNSNVGRGQSLELHVALRNFSGAHIRHVNVRVVEFMRWASAGRRESCRQVQHVLVHHSHILMPSQDCRRQSRRVRRLQSWTPESMEEIHNQIFNELLAHKHPIRVVLPVTARDSFNGELVHVWHRLEIQVRTSKFHSNVQVTIPLRVGTPAAPPPVSFNEQETPQRTNRAAERTPPRRRRMVAMEEEDDPRRMAHDMRRGEEQPGQYDEERRHPTPTAPCEEDSFELEAVEADSLPIVNAATVPDSPVMASLVAEALDVVYLGEDASNELEDEDEPEEALYALPYAPHGGAVGHRPNNGGRCLVKAIDVTSHLRCRNHSLTDMGIPTIPTLSTVESDESLMANNRPSFDNLLAMITQNALDEDTQDEFSLLSQLVMNPEWTPILNQMSPSEYGQLIGSIRPTHYSDQPRVATLLSAYMGDDSFGCAYAAAAIRHTSPSFRHMTVQHLVPLCTDLSIQSHLIYEELRNGDPSLSATCRELEDALVTATAMGWKPRQESKMVEI